MGMHRIAKSVVLGLALAIIALPAIAVAAPGDTAVASTRTQSVSGVEIADQLVKNLNHVALGSSGATATLDVDGAPHDVGLDIGGLQSGITGGKGSGMVGLAIVSAAAAGLLRAAAALARLFR